MSVSYFYSLSGDFFNNLNTRTMHICIDENTIITTELIGISTNGDVVRIDFVSSLSTPEKNELDNLVLTCDQNPLPIPFTNIRYYEESLNESSTTSTNYQTKILLQTQTIPVGVYRICWAYNWRVLNNNSRKRITVRVLFNDSEVIGCHEETGYGPRDGKGIASDFKELDLSEGIYNVKLQFKRYSGSSGGGNDSDSDSDDDSRYRTTVYMSNAKLKLEKI